jgi:hypothetical protein
VLNSFHWHAGLERALDRPATRLLRGSGIRSGRGI